jgi:hypothetical protein
MEKGMNRGSTRLRMSITGLDQTSYVHWDGWLYDLMYAYVVFIERLRVSFSDPVSEIHRS